MVTGYQLTPDELDAWVAAIGDRVMDRIEVEAIGRGLILDTRDRLLIQAAASTGAGLAFNELRAKS